MGLLTTAADDVAPNKVGALIDSGGAGAASVGLLTTAVDDVAAPNVEGALIDSGGAGGIFCVMKTLLSLFAVAERLSATHLLTPPPSGARTNALSWNLAGRASAS